MDGPDRPFRDQFDRAIEHYKAERWSDAVEIFDAIVDDAPLAFRFRVAQHRTYAWGFGLRDLDCGVAIGRRALSEFPDWTEGWHLVGRMEELSSRLPSAIGCYKRAIRLGDRQGISAMAAFALLLGQHRYRTAERLVPLILPFADRFSALPLRLADLYLARGRPEDVLPLLAQHEARTGIDVSRWRELANAQRLNAGRPRSRTPFRHLAIGGVSYIGSTVLGLVVGSLDGFANIGESHWLTQRRDTARALTVPIDFDSDDPRFWAHCRACGRKCEVLTPEFRSRLAENPAGWYEKIAEHLGVEYLVSSDKSLSQYQRLDPEADFDLLVLYKSPASHYRSSLRGVSAKEARNVYVPEQSKTMTAVLHNWVYNYRTLLRAASPKGKRIVMNWECFVQRPEQHFNRLLEVLQLPGSAEVFNLIKPGHFIGGSVTDGVMQAIETERFTPRSSSAAALSIAEVEAASSEPVSQGLFRRMENEHARLFGDLR